MPPRKGKRHAEKRREPPLADESQTYARVTGMLGNGRVRAKFSDGSEHQCRIRGTMRRREWVHVGDVVLVALRDDLAGDKADIVFRYQPAEVQRLRRLGEPVGIALDEDEAQMDDIVAFEADDALPTTATTRAARARDLPPSDSDAGSDADGSSDADSDIDWERI